MSMPSRHPVHGRRIPDVADDGVDAVLAVGIVELEQIERAHAVPALEQVADQVDAEEAGASGDEKPFGRKRDLGHVVPPS